MNQSAFEMQGFETKEYEATQAGLQAALAYLEEFLDSKEAPLKISTQVMIAVEELIVNVVRYSYPNGAGTFKLSLDITGNLFTMYLIDSGVPFNPTERKAPDTGLSAEDREIGGLGIFMVKKTMTSFEYEYKDSKNIVKITKEW